MKQDHLIYRRRKNMLRFVQTLIMWHEQPIKAKITTLTAFVFIYRDGHDVISGVWLSVIPA